MGLKAVCAKILPNVPILYKNIDKAGKKVYNNIILNNKMMSLWALQTEGDVL